MYTANAWRTLFEENHRILILGDRLHNCACSQDHSGKYFTSVLGNYPDNDPSQKMIKNNDLPLKWSLKWDLNTIVYCKGKKNMTNTTFPIAYLSQEYGSTE